jgi:hypothetical protein
LYTLSLGYALPDRFGFYLETYGDLKEFDELALNADGGIIYLVKNNLQIDLSGGHGLNHRISYISAGISWNIRFNRRSVQ